MSKLFDSVLRPAITAASRSQRLKDTSTGLAVTQRVVDRFVPGETDDAVISEVLDLTAAGMAITVDYLGEDTTDEAQATATTSAYLSVLQRLSEIDTPTYPGGLEVSVKLTALGQALPHHGAKIAEENAHTICAAAAQAGVGVTVDAEDHTTVDERLRIVRSLRAEFPELGTVLQAYLRRTEDDCAEFAESGARIRLCKGAYAEPASAAYTGRQFVDEAYLRCLRILMKGNGYPMIASHDPTMIDAARLVAVEVGRDPQSWEYQMLYGIRTDEQHRLAAESRLRVYLPYGQQWYGYFMRRLAERPANLGFFARALMR